MKIRVNLCDFNETDYWRAEAKLGSDKVKDRIKHVIFENERVKKAVSILENGDLKSFGKILCEAHESIRDLYEVTGPELDAMFEIASHTDGCIGSRMTGAGFGGCTVNIVQKRKCRCFYSYGWQYLYRPNRHHAGILRLYRRRRCKRNSLDLSPFI